MATSRHFALNSTTALLVVGFLALFGIVGMTVWLVERSQVYFDDVIEARDTRSAAVELRNALLTAESSQRGYVVTGNQIYLSPFDVARTQAARQLDQLKRLLTPYRENEASLLRLTTVISEKFDEMDRTVALKQNRQDDEALALVRSNRGKALMDEANVFFAGIIRAADERLTVGVSEQRGNAQNLRLAALLGALIIVLVVIAVAASVLRYTRALGRARDEVTALNEGLEQRVEERTADLANANEEIRRFAHVVSHDLRAPLVNISGFTSEVEQSVQTLQTYLDAQAAGGPAPPSEDVRNAAKIDLPEAVAFIRSSTRKMDNLINAVLKLSREGRRRLHAERIDLDDLLRGAASAIGHQISEAGGEITLALRVPSVVTDRLSLEQIVGNLLDNAVKYRAKDRPLRIEVRTQAMLGGGTAIEIQDNGRGIGERDLERVFDLFARAGGATDQPGEGVGLAYVRSMLRNLGGDISVTSKLGEGSTFRLTLPRELQIQPGGSA